MTLTPVLAEFARERDTYREFFLASSSWRAAMADPRATREEVAESMDRLLEAAKACEILEGIRGAVKADTGCCDDTCVACEAITHAEQPK